ncbi:MAG: LysM domain-containing protein [Anaerolineaceae bacterium]|nr:LysM domain-containing protein [Anaerolineaceae bacterium]
MKKFSIAIVVAILIAGQLFSLAAAAAPASGVAATSCGSTYVVQRGDWLARIARTCGTTVASILSFNPQIYNPNWIYGGEVLNLSGTVNTTPQPVSYYNPNVWYGGYYNPNVWYGGYYHAGYWLYGYYHPGYWSYGYYNQAATTSSVARVGLSTYRANAGDSVTVYVSGFPANTDVDIRVGEQGSNWTTVYDGKTGSNGSTSLTIAIPSGANKGEDWVVHVLTTEGKVGAQAYSSVIYITG